MSAFFSKRNKRILFDDFYEKTGIRLTESPKEGIPEQKKSEELYFLSQENPLKAIPEIKKMVEKYPTVPVFKNHLYSAYMLSEQTLKATRLQEQILSEHPKYVFAVCNKILNIQDQEELKKYEELLGHPKDIRSLTGYTTPIHIVEFLMYEGAAGYFEAMTGDSDKAKERLENLIELEASQEQIQFLARTIAIATMQEMANQQEENTLAAIEVDWYPKVTIAQREKAPKLNHAALEIFYTTSIAKISKKQIKQIISLPRASLLEDLNSILEDSIARFDYFQELDYQEKTHEFIFHALYFQGALDAEESLKNTLDLLRMGDDYMEYWFSDYRSEAFYPTIFSQGKNQLSLLKEFVIEENLAPFCRSIVTESVAQIALHYPERRAEVLEWFSTIIQYHLDNPENKGIIDNIFLGMLVGDIMNIRGIELLPLIKLIYKNEWVNGIINGPIEQVITYLKAGHREHEKKPLPEDIYEYYSGKYFERKLPFVPLTDEEVKLQNKMDSPAENAVLKELTELFTEMEEFEESDLHDDFYDEDYDNYEPIYHIEPYKREVPKVGRNEPCPCGSGKKYKKCCINK